MSEFSTVARPYAKAAFDFALEQGQLDKWQAMLQFSALVAENEQVEEYISGALASGQIADFFCNICGTVHIDITKQLLYRCESGFHLFIYSTI